MWDAVSDPSKLSSSSSSLLAYSFERQAAVDLASSLQLKMAPKTSRTERKRDSMSMTVMLMALKSMEKKYRNSTQDLNEARQRLENAERTLKRNDETLAAHLKTITELEYTVSSQARAQTRARVACDEALKQRDAARRERETQAAQLQRSSDECGRLRNDLSLARSRVSTLESDNSELRSHVKEAALDRTRLANRYSARRKSQDLRSHFSSKLVELQSLLIQEQDAPSDAVKNSAIHQQARILSSLTEAAASRSFSGPSVSRPQTPVNSTTVTNSRTSHKRLRVTANSNDSSISSSSLFTPVVSRSTPNFPLETQSSSTHRAPRRDDTEKSTSSSSLFSDRSASSHLNTFRSRPSSANSQGRQQHEYKKAMREERGWTRSTLAFSGILLSVGLGTLALIVMQAHRSSARAHDNGSQKGSGALKCSEGWR